MLKENSLKKILLIILLKMHSVTSKKYSFRFIILLYNIFCYYKFLFYLFDILLVLSDKNRGF